LTEKMKFKTDEAMKIETQVDSIKKIETKAYELKESDKGEVKTELYLQLPGREYSKDDLLKKVGEIWREKFKRHQDEIHTVDIYLKPEEGRAYFVINKEVSGDMEI